MARTFDEWINSLPLEFKEKFSFYEKPLLNMINYILISNLISGEPKLNPSTDELLDWIITEQIDARRK